MRLFCSKFGGIVKEKAEFDPKLVEAIHTIENFVGEVTGTPPTQPELAQCLKRYFILKEILDQIVWEREHPEHSKP